MTPQPEVMVRWRCGHCRKHYATERYAKGHEDHCCKNPANRTCSTCVHFDRQPCCSGPSDECGCYGKNDCRAGVFRGGYADLDYERDCEKWEAAS